MLGTVDETTQQQLLLQLWKELKKKYPPVDGEEEECRVFGTVDDSLDVLKEMAEKNTNVEFHVLVTGSLYLVGGFLEVLNYIIE